MTRDFQTIEPEFSDLSVHREIDRPPLLALADWRRQGRRTALLSIIAIDGKSPRTVGSQMAVSAQGHVHGYLTGGCLEHELVLVAQQVMALGRNESRRYGKGSPYFDLRLPCGSGIDIYFDQALADEVLFEAAARIGRREGFGLVTDLASGGSILRPLDPGEAGRPQPSVADGVFERLVKPRLRLDIYGAGFAAVQLAHLASAMGMGLRFFTSDEIAMSAAAALGIEAISMRESSFSVPVADPWTASMLMFHEHEREIPILEQLVNGPGFYIGAIGSRGVAQQRTQALTDRGVSPEAIARTTMPAGLVRNARSANEIGIGVLAEVLDRARSMGLVT